jgi:hypothetical protein
MAKSESFPEPVMKTYLPRSWISPKLVPGKSAIHGVGIFAAVPIARGEKLMEAGGVPINGEEAASDSYRVRSIWMVDADRFLALPISDTAPSLDENLNHSCDANCWMTDEVTFVARYDIPAGAEITLDQGAWNFEESSWYTEDDAPCSCGAADCRGELTVFDWRRPDVQARYAGHFHPLVQKLLDGHRRG